MKLIKINTDHYVIVDDSEIKEGDYKYCSMDDVNKIHKQSGQFYDTNEYKITHSTLPLEDVMGLTNKLDAKGWVLIKPIYVHEIKELIGEVDVEQKAEELTKHLTFPNERKEGIIIGYNQALEDNKDKKYTEEDLLDAFTWGFMEGTERGDVTDSVNKFSQSLQPKTEWEVEFDTNGKLKLV